MKRQREKGAGRRAPKLNRQVNNHSYIIQPPPNLIPYAIYLSVSPPPSEETTPQTIKDENDLGEQNSQQVAQKSRWQAMLLEAGGISAALSEESMRRLKYCLQWLQVNLPPPSSPFPLSFTHDPIHSMP